MISEAPPIDPETKQIVRQASASGAIGIEIILALGVGYLGGNYLDHRFGTTPWLTRIGVVVGIAAAIKALIRVTRQYQKQIEVDDAAQSKPPGATANQDPGKNAKDAESPPRQD